MRFEKTLNFCGCFKCFFKKKPREMPKQHDNRPKKAEVMPKHSVPKQSGYYKHSQDQEELSNISQKYDYRYFQNQENTSSKVLVSSSPVTKTLPESDTTKLYPNMSDLEDPTGDVLGYKIPRKYSDHRPPPLSSRLVK